MEKYRLRSGNMGKDSEEARGRAFSDVLFYG